VAGAILQLWGIQVFYGARRGVSGWVIGGTFAIALTLLHLLDASIYNRMLLLSATLMLLLLLSCRALLMGIGSRWSFGSVLTLGALALLMLNNLVRIGASIALAPDFLPMTRSPGVVSILYLVPLGGIFLYTTGLLLLYFERLVERKNHLAMHDDLTGLLNRRAIVAGGHREVEVAIRNRKPLTVAFVDIDFFKQVNDNLGHEAGDRVLADVARRLEEVCRTVDLVGRQGGEEFCLVFPGAGADCAPILGERLLTAIRDRPFEGKRQLTISVGFASLSATTGERSWANLVHGADLALYQAKQLGRDRFCLAAQAEGADGCDGATPPARPPTSAR
jgi:diguanylate cyclase (GGDEF)-like protein